MLQCNRIPSALNGHILASSALVLAIFPVEAGCHPILHSFKTSLRKIKPSFRAHSTSNDDISHSDEVACISSSWNITVPPRLDFLSPAVFLGWCSGPGNPCPQPSRQIRLDLARADQIRLDLIRSASIWPGLSRYASI